MRWVFYKRQGGLLMERIARKSRKWKQKVSSRRKAMEEVVRLSEIDDLDVKLALIQALIPVGLKAVNEKLQEEVKALAGEKHRHGKETVRWGAQGGSVYLLDQKVPMTVPRLRNKAHNLEVPLQTYQRLQDPYRGDEQLFKKLLNGLSTHRYRECAELAPEVFGISASNLSRRFKSATMAKLRQLKERRLDRYDVVAVFVDGKRFSDEGLMIALGVTLEGKKIILGIEQMSTENGRAMGQFFEHLLERGLRPEEGILFIVDGSKGITSAIEEVFPTCGVVQRCHYHKTENAVSYLPKDIQGRWRMNLREAYGAPSYEEAKRSLQKLRSQLYQINPSSARSLSEGLEETLSLHRLGLSAELGRSFASTNCIESVMSQLGQVTDKVDRWRGADHLQRWAASGLLELEPRLRRVKGFRYLKLLRMRLREELERRKKKEPLGGPTNGDLGVGIHLSTPQLQG